MAVRTNVPAQKQSTAVTNWEEKLSQMAKTSVEQEASVSTGAFINTRGGQLSHNDQPIADNRLECIVVDAIIENCYYEDDFDPDNPMPPVCYAFGRDDAEMVPHPEAPNKQSETCATCPMNEFGTAPRGKGKACKNIRRLALIPAKPLEEEAIEKGEVAFLKVPVTSVRGWAAYVRTLEALIHRPPLGVVTEISTVPDPKNQFKMLFNHKLDLPQNILGKVFGRYEVIKDSIAFPYTPPPSEPPPKQQQQRGKPAPAKNRKY